LLLLMIAEIKVKEKQRVQHHQSFHRFHYFIFPALIS
jgi:hypothetical protein